VGFGPSSRVELADVIKIVQEVLNSVDVRNDDQLGEADKEVRPTGGVIVQQVQ